MTNLQRLTELDLSDQRRRFPNLPETLIIKTKFSDKDTNSLTRSVVRWLELHGAQVERINTTGRYLPGKTISKGFYGNVNMKGKYIPSTSTSGSADLSSTINGKSIKWEIKCKYTKDRVRPKQLEYAESVRNAGGLYFIVTDFENFIEQYNSIC